MPVEHRVHRVGSCLEEEAKELLVRLNEAGSETQLTDLWTSVYGLMEMK